MKRIVLSAPGVGPRWLGCYGNERVGTPRLDQFAAESRLFDRCYATDPANPYTGWQGAAMGTLVHAGPLPPPEFYAGFAEVFDALPQETDRTRVDGVVRWLKDLQPGDDSSLWIDLPGLLPPWDVPQDVFDAYLEDLEDGEPAEGVPPWRAPATGWFDRDDFESWELLHRSFAAAVTTFDADVGRILDVLVARGWDRSATIAFTSGCGFPLGEHGVLGYYRPWLHDEVCHLPLIVRPPGGCEGRREPGLVAPADLAILLHGETPRRDKIISHWQLGPAAERAVRTDDWTLLVPTAQHPDDADEPRSVQLYEYPADRFEVHDVAGEKEEVVAEFLSEPPA
jgi:hypothetical protein